MFKLCLASASPRRKFLLSKLLSDFEIVESEIEEHPLLKETPTEYVERISIAKSMAARQNLAGRVPVLAADTEVICHGKILGKPADHDEAIAMLLSLSGRAHEVYTGVTLLTDHPLTIINYNKVWFRALDREECEIYSSKYTVLDKAGAYGIQDGAAAFIERLQGSYSGVMGLPLTDTREMLARAGII